MQLNDLGRQAAPPVPRGRLAPSPTGALHLGNARTFLLAWLSIRSRGGSLVLRVEDLDHPKVKPGAAEQAIEDLRWLGLDWDEGPDCGGPFAPYVQTSRTALYKAALETLRDAGRVYPCVCSRHDVEQAQSAPHRSQFRSLGYEGKCRGRFRSWRDACAALPPGRAPVWRFRSEPGETAFTDVFAGLHAQDNAVLGDFAIARDEHGAGYQLACVVDDAAMRITEVVRGDDLMEATHAQLALQRALSLPSPAYFHVPLVVAPDGHRLAKRHGDTRLCALRACGVAPELVCGLLAWWSGMAGFGEKIAPRDLLQRYEMSKIPHRAAVLDEKAWRYLKVDPKITENPGVLA